MKRKIGMNGYYALRWFVLRRDNFTCQYCGQSAPNAKLEVDHVIPVAEGGTDDPGNLKTSCWACNRGKSGLAIQVVRRKQQRAIANPIPMIKNEDTIKAKMIDFLKATPTGMQVNELTSLLKINANTCRVMLTRLKKQGVVSNQLKGLWIYQTG